MSNVQSIILGMYKAGTYIGPNSTAGDEMQ